jgi:hypothetical protein
VNIMFSLSYARVSFRVFMCACVCVCVQINYIASHPRRLRLKLKSHVKVDSRLSATRLSDTVLR